MTTSLEPNPATLTDRDRSTNRRTATATDLRERWTAVSPPAFVRLWLVELRKLVDTPAGIILLAVGALSAGVFGGGAVLLRPDTTYGEVARMAGIPGGMLLPVLAILLVTSERSHRTALSTFAMEPRRSRVLLAKAGAVVTLAVAVTVLSLVAAAVITPVGSMITGHEIPWQIEWQEPLWFTLGTVLAGLSGFALALLIGNGPAAIVIVLGWPTIALIMSIVPEVQEVLSWVDVAAVSTLEDGATGTEVAKVITGIACWVVVPGIIGWIRTVRSEVV
ncbi:hypothetical protein ACQBAU_16735 [Propionibacteriaceae bacterium Y2011]